MLIYRKLPSMFDNVGIDIIGKIDKGFTDWI